MTDSELKAKLEAWAAEMAPLAKVSRPSEAQLKRFDELIRDKGIFEKDHAEIVMRRRRGELTDTSRIDAAWKIISARAADFFIPVAHDWVQAEEFELGNLARFWHLRVFFAGKLNSFAREDWDKVVRKLDEAVAHLDFVSRDESADNWDLHKPLIPPSILRAHELWRKREDRRPVDEVEHARWLKAMENDEDYEPPEDKDPDPMRDQERRFAAWTINTWIFDRPESGRK